MVLKIGSNSLGGMSLGLCHPRTKLNQPFPPTRAVEPAIGHFGPFLGPRGPRIEKINGLKVAQLRQVAKLIQVAKLRPPQGHCSWYTSTWYTGTHWMFGPDDLDVFDVLYVLDDLDDS